MVAKLRALTAIAPLASILTGFLLVLNGLFQDQLAPLQAGWGFVTAGIALQATYLLTRHVS